MLRSRTRRLLSESTGRGSKSNWICPKCIKRRNFAAVTDISRYPRIGEKLHGFTLQRAKDVPEFQLTALHFQHDKTGAEYLHIARDDKNNVFSIGFKTNPPDDTGVPHILEHTTLCGSDKYPVRDPFFKMLPRSLSNFMNAFTSSDHTSYPFATTNQKDFNNLMSVYLDATLHPLLKKSDFAQEGWRIGPANPEAIGSNSGSTDHDQPLVFKGVVYNEMKGQMSDSGYLYYIRYQDHIFPDIHNSGGDPQKMTDLTYEDLKNFHASHYHPSNAKIFTYGNMPLESHLEKVGRELNVFDRIRADQTTKLPIQITKPLEVVVSGPVDPLVDPEMQYTTSTSWIMGDTSDILETFSLSIMSSLLLDGYGSPLYKALIESGLGPEWSPNTGFDSAGKVAIFAVGLNGVKKEDVPKIKASTIRALEAIKDSGFDKSKVDGILHQLELSLKHKTANFGMGLMQRLQPGWFNGVDPFDALAWDKTVSDFKKKFAEPNYLEDLLDKYLLNDKTLTFTMEPSATYGEDLVREEAKRLSGKISEVVTSSGSEEKAREELTTQELRLLEVQEQARNQSLDALPMVHVTDIPRQLEHKPLSDSSIGDVKVQWRQANTNGLTYFRALQSLGELPEELRILAPLFCDSILRLGTKKMAMGEIEDLIKLKTGGLRTSYFSTTDPANIHKTTEGLSFSGYSLDNKVPDMLELLRTIILETNFDGPEAESMIKQLLQSDAAGALGDIANSGHAYARRYAEAGLTQYGFWTEQVNGLTQVRNVASLAARKPEEGLGDVIGKLKQIQSLAITNSPSFRAAITCGAESVSQNESELGKFLSRLPTSTEQPTIHPQQTTLARNSKTFFPLPYQVYYSSFSVPTVPYLDAAGAPLQILSQLLTHKHLHHEIREKGGAYGGGAYAKSLTGVFGFYSYRDPNPQNTVKIIADTGRWACDKQWSDQDIEEAKLSVFQQVDAPESVSEEGMTRFLSGVDETMEQAKREQLLDVKLGDVQEVAHKYLVEGADKGRLVVLGEKKDWVSESEGWEIKQVNV